MTKSDQKNGTDPFLLSLLVCPVSGSVLMLSKEKKELMSKPAKLAFPIRDGIPILVESEARPLTEDELKKI